MQKTGTAVPSTNALSQKTPTPAVFLRVAQARSRTGRRALVAPISYQASLPGSLSVVRRRNGSCRPLAWGTTGISYAAACNDLDQLSHSPQVPPPHVRLENVDVTALDELAEPVLDVFHARISISACRRWQRNRAYLPRGKLGLWKRRFQLRKAIKAIRTQDRFRSKHAIANSTVYWTFSAIQ